MTLLFYLLTYQELQVEYETKNDNKRFENFKSVTQLSLKKIVNDVRKKESQFKFALRLNTSTQILFSTTANYYPKKGFTTFE